MSALVQRWRESASNHANQLALVYEGDSLTYRDLSDQVEQRARKLRAFLGVGYSPVGLAAQETLKEIVDVLALLVLGRPYLYLENDTNCSNALGEKAGIQVVVGRHESSPVSPTAEIGVPDILCLLRTSGTTDRPKLVARSHQAALRNIENYGESCLLTPADRVALTAPPSRGPFLSQLLGGLLHGAEVHVFDFKKRGSAEFGEWLRKTRVTQVHLVPSIFVRTCETLGSQTLPDLSTVRLGGETLRWEQVKLFKRTAPRARILNGYSASEAAGNICCHELQEMREAGIVPVGRPVGGREIMIVDSSGRRLKVGERGRIVVRSRHLASGYWTESVLSQVSFRKDGTEWWSDDEGYLDEEGVLFHCGRLDRTVKLLGRRIDLESYEQVLNELEGVKQSRCLFEDGVLIARVNSVTEGSVSVVRIREKLDSLDSTPQPWKVVLNGREADSAGETGTSLYCRTLSTLLRRPVGPGDNFFQLGGTSLLAAEWIQQLAAHGVRLSLREIASFPDLAGLERAIGQASFPYLHRVEGTVPLWFIPGGRGDSTEFLEFGPALQGLSRSVAGLALFETGTESLDDMVRCALGALLNEDANTSTLLGWCTGAWLALEIGERLRQSGKEVKVLLVDPPPPVRGNDGGSRSRRFRGIIRDLGASLKRSGRHLQLLLSGPLRSRTRHANHLLRTANLVMRGRRWTPADFDAEEYLQKRRDYSRLLKRAGRRRFSCRVTLLLTAERQSGTHLWVEYLEPPVEIVELPGHHDNFYLEHREELITRINSLLG